ncbi:glycosyltransferase [Fluoribacter dumoffii]|uniref:glycosyltransferase n=1 Tax=Fluoribacter dumoffii TaxID=463 RepID=UPI002244D991|nr:glycosyltransferase [Fluoribacter dumoffii]MCW8387207.1 glycosyltransferase [Fluoribacter dumoffii]MCW8417288.1 glycosyltransferase [Fluoribacter dumoffii]MCW8454871.1 glycosyltransferase [Fluoribacter dumoffii]MCW8461052.1 glycosyltransferase [Fluoribacter dumoffii]MCW8484493.1 glycosyltransferase [Fluoribacter dumoffii]
MKILNVNVTIDSLTGGGTAERTNQMSRFLAQQNHECTILTLDSNLSKDKQTELQNIKLITLPYFSKRFLIPKGGLKKIKTAVHEADIIHIMNHWTILNAIVYCYARHLGKPYVVCPAGALPIFGRSRILKRIFNFIIGKKIIKNANAHIAIALNEIDHYKVYGIQESKITLIPNGVILDDFQENKNAATQFKLPEKYILFMGRLNYIKGPDLILKAFARLPAEYQNYHFVFAGPDEGMLAFLQNLIKNSPLAEKVHFIGSVAKADRVRTYQNAMFLVVPSRQEAMSLVVIEAGIFSKPVLITDQCGFNLEEADAGYVVQANVAGLEQGLIKMLSNSTRNNMGSNLNKLILKNYTWDSIGEKIVDLYQRVLQ